MPSLLRHISSGYYGTGVQNSQKFRAGTKNAVPVPRVLWRGAYRTHRSSGYGYEGPTELTEVPGTGMKVLQNSRKFWVLWHGRTELTEVPGKYKNAVPLPLVLWPRAYRTYRSSGYGYECHTELTEVPGTGMKVLQNFQKFRVLWHGRTDLTEVPGTGMNVVQDSQKFFVRV